MAVGVGTGAVVALAVGVTGGFGVSDVSLDVSFGGVGLGVAGRGDVGLAVGFVEAFGFGGFASDFGGFGAFGGFGGEVAGLAGGVAVGLGVCEGVGVAVGDAVGVGAGAAVGLSLSPAVGVGAGVPLSAGAGVSPATRGAARDESVPDFSERVREDLSVDGTGAALLLTCSLGASSCPDAPSSRGVRSERCLEAETGRCLAAESSDEDSFPLPDRVLSGVAESDSSAGGVSADEFEEREVREVREEEGSDSAELFSSAGESSAGELSAGEFRSTPDGAESDGCRADTEEPSDSESGGRSDSADGESSDAAWGASAGAVAGASTPGSATAVQGWAMIAPAVADTPARRRPETRVTRRDGLRGGIDAFPRSRGWDRDRRGASSPRR